ncbi:RNA-binding S4 domain-containing protein [Paraoerskovia marina]|uniref:Ribosome-associated protein n=1 Tax=Paraoerskovia marina TaxID=545619 RepID=A0A1H1TNH6_9CELL|nr:RNA-binding S4 domain-containing protein [Paraoerskovia marina]SDS61800.1 ribosome-associated protein [Paraoerskovia marina]
MNSSEPVTIDGESIRLGQFLKLADLAESGADARELITDGEVSVNGEVETRRGRQLVRGDVVAVAMPQGEISATVA